MRSGLPLESPAAFLLRTWLNAIVASKGKAARLHNI